MIFKSKHRGSPHTRISCSSHNNHYFTMEVKRVLYCFRNHNSLLQKVWGLSSFDFSLNFKLLWNPFTSQFRLLLFPIFLPSSRTYTESQVHRQIPATPSYLSKQGLHSLSSLSVYSLFLFASKLLPNPPWLQELYMSRLQVQTIYLSHRGRIFTSAPPPYVVSISHKLMVPNTSLITCASWTPGTNSPGEGGSSNPCISNCISRIVSLVLTFGRRSFTDIKTRIF